MKRSTLESFFGGLLMTIVNWTIHTGMNAIGSWIILDALDKTHLGFWTYVIIGFGLTLIVNGNTASTD